MKISCPRCGRGIVADEEAGDFPTRCMRCGALVRRRGEAASTENTPPVPASTRIERGMLAGLLISRSAPTSPAIIHAQEGGGGTVTREDQAHRVLRPESKREILRVRARQQALARAELQGNSQALGALTWAGLVLVAMLGIGALALKANDMLRHPAPARADTLQVNP